MFSKGKENNMIWGSQYLGVADSRVESSSYLSPRPGWATGDIKKNKTPNNRPKNQINIPSKQAKRVKLVATF